MEALLRNDFTVHYGLPISTTVNISLNTTAAYFEIEDDELREIKLHTAVGVGMAAYQNINNYPTVVINYDKFITGLPHAFQHGKKRCDLIVHTHNKMHFLLNELKDRTPKARVRTKSIKQLLASLGLIMGVPSIAVFANGFTTKRCCFFNKQSMSPPTITASAAFNRLGAVIANGLQMSNPAIESFGFEFWEFSGNQVYTL